MKDTRINPDGSITVGIIPPEENKVKEDRETPTPKTKKSTKTKAK